MPNMTYQEKDTFVSLMEKHIDIIENKKTNGISNDTKNLQWEKIVTTFNCSGLGPHQDASNQKMCWKNFKTIFSENDSREKDGVLQNRYVDAT